VAVQALADDNRYAVYQELATSDHCGCPPRAGGALGGPFQHQPMHSSARDVGLWIGAVTRGRRTAPAPYFLAAGCSGPQGSTRRPMPSWAGSMAALAGAGRGRARRRRRDRSGRGCRGGPRMPAAPRQRARDRVARLGFETRLGPRRDVGGGRTDRVPALTVRELPRPTGARVSTQSRTLQSGSSSYEVGLGQLTNGKCRNSIRSATPRRTVAGPEAGSIGRPATTRSRRR